ncbi:MAG: hypothetical protein H8E53_00440 [Planctomycetes bacterium]|nr:hypothetical protein [Planctomycetota bacterium]
MRLSTITWLVVTCSLVVPAAAGDWPQFHGPNRDNKSLDKGLLKKWSQDGPMRIWEASGIGHGYSTVSIAGKRIYTTGSINGDCVITAMDMNGKKLWTRTKYRNGCLTYADGMFYLYADNGTMVLARATDKGFEVTGRLKIKDPGKNPTWAHPVVCGGRLYIRYGNKLGVYNVIER